MKGGEKPGFVVAEGLNLAVDDTVRQATSFLNFIQSVEPQRRILAACCLFCKGHPA
jgi:hypothetical protein